MQILVTGNYKPEYNRNKILLKGLQRRTDVNLILRPFEEGRPSAQGYENCDCVFLPSFTHGDVLEVKKQCNKPLIFDPLISKYLTKVFDYKQVSKWSPRAYKNYLKDKRPMQACDVLLADTQSHADYFSDTFRIDPKKIHVLPIGVDSDEYPPSTRTFSPPFKVGFYGGFIPLQGVEVMLHAMHLLTSNSDIEFELLGDGFQFEAMKKLASKLSLNNLKFAGWVDEEKLSDRLDNYDLCLGIFGQSLKSDLVVPNKLYHYAAKKIAFITKESQAVKEVFEHDKNCYLCEGNAEDLARSILHLKEDEDLRKRLAQNALNLVETKYQTEHIAERFVDILKKAGLF